MLIIILFIFNKYKGITFKRLHKNNLDKNFSNFISKSFWLRRKMQIEYNYFLNGKNILTWII